ncbi:unnamed protein product [Allacma fusca]|uniref:F-box domain-containing protein n=1 Tax=Allacma fusca TaxID=39272 RepID=A0A8J2NVM2_9HEXA|nr:unnamed protein product [Allacma fusca]
MSTISSLGSFTPPLTPKPKHRRSFGMWETDIDGYGDVIEEMRTTQRKINRWMEIWQFVERQLAEKEVTLMALQKSGEEQRLENEIMMKQLDARNGVIIQLAKASERAKRRALILDHVKRKLLELLKESQNPAVVQAKALREVLRRHGTLHDLKKCRSVSKSWNQVATPLLRNLSAQIDFDDNFILDNFLGIMEFSDDSVPTADYKLDESCLYIGNENRIGNFLTLCGPTIQTLSLTCTESFLNNFAVNLSHISFHNLKVLFVLITNGDIAVNRVSSSLSQVGASFLPSLVKSAPNLEKLSLIITPSMENKREDKYKKLLQETFQFLGPKCKFLEVDAQISDANLRALRSSGRFLTDLHLILKESHMSAEAFYDFLESQSPSLEHLKIIYDEPLGRMNFEFPALLNIQSLTLKGFQGRDCVEPISYGKLFPSLTRFNLTCTNDDTGNEWNGFFPTNISPCTGVLEMMLTMTRFDTVSYHRIGKIFPALKKLRLVVPLTTPEVQESLWCAMPNLEELEFHLHGGSSTFLDELFTGIPADRCNRILEQRAFFDVAVDRIRKRPSLTHLKSLKRLKLNLKDHVVTDVTGYLAFLPMKNLKYLEITYGNDCELSHECQRVLRQRFQLSCRKR